MMERWRIRRRPTKTKTKTKTARRAVLALRTLEALRTRAVRRPAVPRAVITPVEIIPEATPVVVTIPVVAVMRMSPVVTIIIIRQNEAGDTVKQSVVTDRYRGRNAEAAKVDFPLRAVELNLHDERLTVQRDTVYIEKRDSSLQVTAYGLQEDGTPTISSKLSAVSKIMKWIFWILIGLIGLIVTAKVCHRR